MHWLGNPRAYLNELDPETAEHITRPPFLRTYIQVSNHSLLTLVSDEVRFDGGTDSTRDAFMLVRRLSIVAIAFSEYRRRCGLLGASAPSLAGDEGASSGSSSLSEDWTSYVTLLKLSILYYFLLGCFKYFYRGNYLWYLYSNVTTI